MNLKFIASLKSYQLLSFQEEGSLSAYSQQEAWKNEVCCVFSSLWQLCLGWTFLEALSYLVSQGLHAFSISQLSFQEGALYECPSWLRLAVDCLLWLWIKPPLIWLLSWNVIHQACQLAAKDRIVTQRKKWQGVDGWLILHRQRVVVPSVLQRCYDC